MVRAPKCTFSLYSGYDSRESSVFDELGALCILMVMVSSVYMETRCEKFLATKFPVTYPIYLNNPEKLASLWFNRSSLRSEGSATIARKVIRKVALRLILVNGKRGKANLMLRRIVLELRMVLIHFLISSTHFFFSFYASLSTHVFHSLLDLLA